MKKIFLLSLCCMPFANGADLDISGGGSFALGRFFSGEARSVSFAMHNTLKVPVTLGRIRTSCTCASAALQKSAMAPGEKNSLNVALDTNSISGAFCYKIYVETDIPGRRFLSFTVTGEALPAARITPSSSIDTGALVSGNEYRYEFLVIPADASVKLRREIYGLPDWMSAVLDDEQDGKRRVILKLKPDTALPAFDARLKIPASSGTELSPVSIRITGSVSSGRSGVEGDERKAL